MKNVLKEIFLSFVEWFKPKYKVYPTVDIPTYIKDRTIYVVGNQSEPWLVSFKCPCGCNKDIHLNLLPDANPRWKIYLKSGNKIDISPSVWRTSGCRSHFFIRSGKVVWVLK